MSATTFSQIRAAERSRRSAGHLQAGLGAGAVGLVLGLGEQAMQQPAALMHALYAGGMTGLVLLAAAKTGTRAAPQCAAVVCLLSVVTDLLLIRLNPAQVSRTMAIQTVGAVGFLALLRWLPELDRLRSAALCAAPAGLVLSFAPLIPGLGTDPGGSQTYLKVAGEVFNPGSLSRLLLVLGVAVALQRHRDALASAGHLGQRALPQIGPALAVVGASIIAVLLLALTHDLGGALVLTTAVAIQVLHATGRRQYAGLTIALTGIATTLLYPHLPYLQRRVADWQHPLRANNPSDQVSNARWAWFNGDWSGLGFGNGLVHRRGRISAADTDYPLVFLANEAGVLAALAVIGLLCVLLVALWRHTSRAALGFSADATTGLAALLTAQTVVMLAGLTGLAPMTGLPTPGLTRSGSDILTLWLTVALVVRARQSSQASRGGETDPIGARHLRRTHRGAVLALVAFAISAIHLAVTAPAGAVPNPAARWAYAAQRGDIRTIDGFTIASNNGGRALDTMTRTYFDQGMFADTSGVATPWGRTDGIEKAWDGALLCNRVPHDRTGSLGTPLSARERQDRPCTQQGTVVLTMDARLQKILVDALDIGQPAQAMLINLDTGAILAAAANPTLKTEGASDDIATAYKVRTLLDADALGTRLWTLRTLPGSTIKPTIALTRTRQGADTSYPFRSTITVAGGNYTLHNHDGLPCGGSLSLELAQSCNVAFGQMALDAGAPAILQTANDLGLTTPSTVSGLKIPASNVVEQAPTDTVLALIGIGQAQAAFTIVGQARVLQVIGTGGMQAPLHVVTQVCGHRSWTYRGEAQRVLDRKTVEPVRAALSEVTKTGTAKALRNVPGGVYGKTGTASVGDRRHSDIGWFVGGVDHGSSTGEIRLGIIVRVLPDDQHRNPSGPATAVPIARHILQATSRWTANRTGQC